MSRFDGEAFGRQIVGIVKRYVEPVQAANAALAAQNAELVTRLDKIERSIAAATMRGAVIDRRGVLILTLGDGETRELGEVVGRSVEAAEVKAMVEEAVSALPRPPAPAAKAPDLEDLRPMVGQIVEAELAARPPRDGRDADPAETRAMVAELVEEAVAALPKPQDGRDADPAETRAMVEELVGEAVAALPKPQNGKDADPEETRALVEATVARHIAALPKPQDGKSVDPGELARMVAEAVDVRVRALPAPQPGKDADPEETRAMVAEAVAAAVAELPRGREVAEAMIDAAGELVLVMSDGKMLKAGRVVGEDGIGADDLELRSLDGGRTIEVRLRAGEREIVREVRTAALVDRGVWQPGAYHHGDGVTYKGSYWIAERDTDGKPADGDPDSGWRLAIKRGRDGRDAVRPGHNGRAAGGGVSS